MLTLVAEMELFGNLWLALLQLQQSFFLSLWALLEVCIDCGGVEGWGAESWGLVFKSSNLRSFIRVCSWFLVFANSGWLLWRQYWSVSQIYEQGWRALLALTSLALLTNSSKLSNSRPHYFISAWTDDFRLLRKYQIIIGSLEASATLNS